MAAIRAKIGNLSACFPQKSKGLYLSLDFFFMKQTKLVQSSRSDGTDLGSQIVVQVKISLESINLLRNLVPVLLFL